MKFASYTENVQTCIFLNILSGSYLAPAFSQIKSNNARDKSHASDQYSTVYEEARKKLSTVLRMIRRDQAS